MSDQLSHAKDYKVWEEAALKSLKMESSEELEAFLKHMSIEDIELNAFVTRSIKDINLKTFPNERILARYIHSGLASHEHHEDGLDYVVTNNPTTITKEQKLIQVIQDKNAILYGDEILIDIFALLESFNYDSEEIQVYLEKMVTKKHVHLLINGSELHNSGATIVQELAASLHLMLRFMEPFLKAHRKICFMTSIDSSYFSQIAKLRGLRFLLEKLFDEFEINHDRFLIIARGSLREMTLYDSWSNMIRITGQVSSALVGGADVIVPTCYDVLNQIYALKESSPQALRHSRNTFHVLVEESGLTRVKDSAKGSFVIADLTDKITHQTLEELKVHAQQKSLLYVYEKLSDKVAEKNKQREEQLSFRKKTVCGINNYPHHAERVSPKFNSKMLQKRRGVNSLFPFRRDSEDFETLRLKLEENHFAGKKVLLLHYGDLKKINPRITFCQNYFESLGLEVETLPLNENLSWDQQEYLGVIFCAQDAEYDKVFELMDTQPDIPSFVAGKKFQKDNFTNIYQGQNVFKLLNDFGQGIGVK